MDFQYIYIYIYILLVFLVLLRMCFLVFDFFMGLVVTVDCGRNGSLVAVLVVVW